MSTKITKREVTDPETGEIKTVTDFKSDGSIYLPNQHGTVTRVLLPLRSSTYTYDTDAATAATGLSCPEPTMAQQQFREDSDINTLVERFKITGAMPQLEQVPLMDEFVGLTSYQEAMNALIAAQGDFMKLPHDVRRQFDNDPHKFLEFTSDETNIDKMAEMGFLKPEAIERLQAARHGQDKPPTGAPQDAPKGGPVT